MKLKMYFIKYANLFPFKVSFLMRFYHRKIIFPFYHSVSNEPQDFIRHLYKVKTEEEFKKDIGFLLKYFKPISAKKFMNWVEKKENVSEPSFLLSFDDGLKSILQVSQFLKENNIQPICFLNTDFINSKKIFYRYKVSILIDRIRSTNWLNEQTNIISKIIKEGGSKKNLINWLLNANYSQINTIDKLSDILEVSFENILKEESPYLDENQINKLINDGFYFGAHSCSHPNYSLLSKEEQLIETFNSIKDVQTKFSLNYKFFSFPFNDLFVFNEVFNKLKTENVISFGTSGLKDDDLENNFQRIPMEYNEKYSAEQIIKGELVYYFFKKIIGKHKMQRII